jgi:AcrR family transcriptional regulator
MSKSKAGDGTSAASGAPESGSATPEDGRTARRTRNREAVLDAVIELFVEDQMLPSAADVAERSGVSLRSVYRYFDDSEQLVRAALARQVRRFESAFVIEDLGEGPLGERVERFVDARLRLFDAVAPAARAAMARQYSVPVIGEQVVQRRTVMSTQAAAMFAPELGRLSATAAGDALAIVDTLTQFEGLEFLLRHRGLTRAAARRTLVTGLNRLLA